jgi:hypothetical protein
MQQHSQEPQPDQNSDLASARAQGLPVHPAIEAKLTAYLDAICRHLPSEVPSTEVQEMRLEMQGHLLASLAAHREIAATEEEAISPVLTQFGKPHLVAQKWTQEWQTTLAEMPNAPFRSSLLPAMGVWGLTYTGLLGMGAVIRTFPTMPDVQRVAWTMLGLFGLPLLAGGVVGLLVRRRPVVSSAVASIAVLPLYLLINMALLNAISPDGWKASLWFAINPLLIWMPLSSLSAALTAQVRRMTKRQRIAR